MGQPAAKKARGGAEGLVPTIREFLPWHVIEKKMAARAQGRIHDDAAPDSGVYASGEHAAAVIAANQNDDAGPPGDPLVPTDSGGLSYQVYTVKDLEARGLKADLSVSSTRMSMVALSLRAAKPNPWSDVGRAIIVVVRLAKTWLAAPSPKPPITAAFRAPIVALTYELRQATKTIDWKKVATYAGVSIGVFLFLLFAVITAADLTDDLKPSRVSNTQQTGDSYTNAIVAAQHAPPPAPAPKAVDPGAAASAGDGLEVSAEPTPPPPVAKAAHPKKKATGTKKKKSGEVFTP